MSEILVSCGFFYFGDIIFDFLFLFFFANKQSILCIDNNKTFQPVLNLSFSATNTSYISGRYFSKAIKIFFTFQKKIPAFHRKSPLAIKVLANSRLGFSVNVLTLKMPGAASIVSCCI